MTRKSTVFARAIAALFVLCLLGMSFLPTLGAAAKDVAYDIVFRTGSHGTFEGIEGTSVTFSVPYQGVFPDVPNVVPESGYVFKGWSEELPDVGSAVTGKKVFVAKYGVLVSGQEYKVRYVNDADVDLLTAKVTIAENGSVVTERARTIEGYTPVETQKSITVSAGENVITFVYRSDGAGEPSSQPAGSQNTSSSAGAAGNQAGTDNVPQGSQPETNASGEAPESTGSTASIPDGEVPLGSAPQNIDDSEVPLADRPDGASNNMGVLIGGGAVAVLAAIGVILFVAKKKKQAGQS